jgi:acylphosphatase
MVDVACRRFLVQGRVQGVFFRASTAREAAALEITGHAINLPDGTVEVLACGRPRAVADLARWLQKGPPSARVDKVTVNEIERPQSLPGTFRTG